MIDKVIIPLLYFVFSFHVPYILSHWFDLKIRFHDVTAPQELNKTIIFKLLLLIHITYSFLTYEVFITYIFYKTSFKVLFMPRKYKITLLGHWYQLEPTETFTSPNHSQETAFSTSSKFMQTPPHPRINTCKPLITSSLLAKSIRDR